MPLGEHVIAGKTLSHIRFSRASLSISSSAARPASASPEKLGGAGSGGPSMTFWRQLRQPPIERATP